MRCWTIRGTRERNVNLTLIPTIKAATGIGQRLAAKGEPKNGGAGGDGGRAGKGESPKTPPKVIAVTSGKGGVGKSAISANLGLCLAQMGRRVLLVDADLALANLDLMLGVSARATIRDVLDGELAIEDVMVEGPHGVHLLPACNGDSGLAGLSKQTQLAFFTAIDSLEDRFDTVVVDTGAGIGSNSTTFAAAAQETVVVVTPDPASMADAYAMIKVLSQQCGVRRLYLVVNMASGPKEAEAVVTRLLDLVGQFLEVSVIPVGYVYQDSAVEESVRRCRPLVVHYPQAAVTASLSALARRLLEEQPQDCSWGGPRLFWKKLVGASEMQG
jgi:flagellar biosynthesis protein FlhG